MAHAAANFKRIPKPQSRQAHQTHQVKRRTATVESTNVRVGNGADFGGINVGSTFNGQYPGVFLTSAGLAAYNSGGVQTMFIDANSGNVAITGTGVFLGSQFLSNFGFPRTQLDNSGFIAYNSAGVPSVTISTATGDIVSTAPSSRITGGTIETSVAGTNPRVAINSSGLHAFNGAGAEVVTINTVTGTLSVTGGTLTGSVMQTAATGARVVFDTGGIRAYNAGGTNTVNVGVDGSLTVSGTGSITGATISGTSITGGTISGSTITGVTLTGQIIQTSSASVSKVIINTTGIHALNPSGTETVTIGTDGKLTMLAGTLTLSSSVPAGTGARVVLDATGIKAWNASNVQTFVLDGTTGLISATGVINAQTGSTIPTGTITGNLPGGANKYSNTTFQDSSGVLTTAGWSVFPSATDTPYIAALVESGGTDVPPVSGIITLKVTSKDGTNQPGIAIRVGNVIDSHRLVVPGSKYTASHYVWPKSTNTGVNDNNIRFFWYDVTGNAIATTPGWDSVGPWKTVTPGQWNRISYTSTAPPGAVYATVNHSVCSVPNLNDVFYVECLQFEEGDRVSAWAPRTDEILVPSLSAINANLGNVTAGTITGATIQTATSGSRIVLDGTGLHGFTPSGVEQFTVSATTGIATITAGVISGSTFQTSGSDPKTTLGTGGLSITDSTGSKVFQVAHNISTYGMQFKILTTGALNGYGAIGWLTSIPSGNPLMTFGSGVTGLPSTRSSGLWAVYPNAASPQQAEFILQGSRETGDDAYNNAQAQVWNAAGSVSYAVVMIDGAARSSFVQNIGRLARNLYYGWPSQVNRTTTYGLAAGWQQISWGTLTSDTHGYWNGGGWTSGEAGTYRMTFYCEVTNNTGGNLDFAIGWNAAAIMARCTVPNTLVNALYGERIFFIGAGVVVNPTAYVSTIAGFGVVMSEAWSEFQRIA